MTSTGVEPPHPNGEVAAPRRPRRRRMVAVAIGIVLAAVWIFAIVWSVTITNSSPERLDAAATAAVASACQETRDRLRALPHRFPREGADRVARLRAENDVLLAMVDEISTVQPTGESPARALTAWTEDWRELIDARARYADDLQSVAGTDEQVFFSVPASRGVQPITERMDDFVRENNPDLDGCYTEALEAEQVEGERDYEDVRK